MHTDTRYDEQKRRLSIKAIPMSLLMPSSSGKSFALNIVDTPGHVNFIDEVRVATGMAGGICVHSCMDSCAWMHTCAPAQISACTQTYMSVYIYR